MLNSRILLPLYMVLIWSISRIYKAYILINYEINPTVFALYALFFASLILIINGKNNKKLLRLTFETSHHFIYSIFEILSQIIAILILFYVGSTEGSHLIQLCTVTAIIYGNTKNKRDKKTSDIFLSILILSGVFYALNKTPNYQLLPVFYLTILFSLIMTIKTVIAEKNPLNKLHINNKAKMKVTGFAIGISTIIFSFSLPLIKLISSIVLKKDILTWLPNYTDFSNKPTIFLGFIYGVVLISIGRYIYLKASKTTKTETLLTIAALTPFTVLLLELISYKFGLFNSTSIDLIDILICSSVALEVIALTIIRNYKIFSLKKKVTTSFKSNVTKDYVKRTMP